LERGAGQRFLKRLTIGAAKEKAATSCRTPNSANYFATSFADTF
jgi:hypothetical protein